MGFRNVGNCQSPPRNIPKEQRPRTPRRKLEFTHCTIHFQLHSHKVHRHPHICMRKPSLNSTFCAFTTKSFYYIYYITVWENYKDCKNGFTLNEYLNLTVNSSSKKEYKPNYLTKFTAPKRIKFQVAVFMQLWGTNITVTERQWSFIYLFVVYWTLLLGTQTVQQGFGRSTYTR